MSKLVQLKQKNEEVYPKTSPARLLWGGQLKEGEYISLPSDTYDKYKELVFATYMGDGNVNNSTLRMLILRNGRSYTRTSGVTTNDYSTSSATYWNVQFNHDGGVTVRQCWGGMSGTAYIGEIYGLE